MNRVNRIFRAVFLLAVVLLLLRPAVGEMAAATTVQNVRVSQTAEKVRIVLDVDNLPAYRAAIAEQPLRLEVKLPATAYHGDTAKINFNDAVVSDLALTQTGPGELCAVVNLKSAAAYKVFSLTKPNRLVIDILKNFDHKIQQNIAPGVTQTTWLKSGTAGPLAVYILDVDLHSAAYEIRPILSNEAIAGLETVKAMAGRRQALAAVNGSYFGPDGSIIGLLKLNGEVISTPGLPRAAFGQLPDGQLLIDEVDYNGQVQLPDGKTLAISGVNCERGANELVLYNKYFGLATGTNPYGQEYVIADGRVAASGQFNTPLTDGRVVLSAHGSAAAALAGLKVGDAVKITQTLGDAWDKTVYALGAGPLLVKDGKVFVTTKTEQFGSDVAGGRAPRTALGLTDQDHLLLVVVDGRQTHSIGCTLLEMATLMRQLGAQNALNLDGGGSSEMVINGEVVNKPSDGRERPVGDALGIFPIKLAK